MSKKIIKLCLLLIVFVLLISIFIKFNNTYHKIVNINSYIDNEKSSNISGYLKIDQINLLEVINNIDSNLNSLNNGLMLYYLNPFVILGHSGTGKTALFNDLKLLKLNDTFEFSYNKTIYNYKIIKIYKKNKKDYLTLEGDIILVTCLKNDNNKQLVLVGQKLNF
ncbi:MAG: sortase [Bacilli bacterium]|nr:sortase [Bacilli bacterium]